MQNKRTVSKVGVATMLLALASAGCRTMTIPQYTDGPGGRARSQEAQGLKITADPFTDTDRADKYFKVKPAERGIAIVHLRAENRAADTTWLLDEENMRLTALPRAGDMNARGQGVLSDPTAGVALGVAAAWTFNITLLAASNKAFSDELVIEKNFVDNEWRNQTLSPGETAEGFIYFNLGKKTDLGSAAVLRIDCVNTHTRQTNSFSFPLAYESK